MVKYVAAAEYAAMQNFSTVKEKFAPIMLLFHSLLHAFREHTVTFRLRYFDRVIFYITLTNESFGIYHNFS